MTKIRKAQAPAPLSRTQLHYRFTQSFKDPLFAPQEAAQYGRRIYPRKGCVATAMPLCHWPCSCYPNHSLGQTGDWMAEIYEPVQEEVRNVARAVVNAVREARAGRLSMPDAKLESPRQK
jgi:hypothetical protein